MPGAEVIDFKTKKDAILKERELLQPWAGRLLVVTRPGDAHHQYIGDVVSNRLVAQSAHSRDAAIMVIATAEDYEENHEPIDEMVDQIDRRIPGGYDILHPIFWHPGDGEFTTENLIGEADKFNAGLPPQSLGAVIALDFQGSCRRKIPGIRPLAKGLFLPTPRGRWAEYSIDDGGSLPPSLPWAS